MAESTSDRVKDIRELAEAVFNDIVIAKTWVTTPNLALGGQAPLQLCETQEGAQQVRRVLHAIESGGSV